MCDQTRRPGAAHWRTRGLDSGTALDASAPPRKRGGARRRAHVREQCRNHVGRARDSIPAAFPDRAPALPASACRTSCGARALASTYGHPAELDRPAIARALASCIVTVAPAGNGAEIMLAEGATRFRHRSKGAPASAYRSSRSSAARYRARFVFGNPPAWAASENRVERGQARALPSRDESGTFSISGSIRTCDFGIVHGKRAATT